MSESKQIISYSKVYDDLYKIGYHADPQYSHSYALIEYLCKECDFATVLDVGASIGAAVAHLTNRGKLAWGVETSLVAVNKADKLGRPVLWGEAQRLPFADKSIDCVLSTDVFEHLTEEDALKAIEEAHRVAKKYIAMKLGLQPERAGWGKKVGVNDLHLTVKPLDWWKTHFLNFGGKVIFEGGDTFVLSLTSPNR